MTFASLKDLERRIILTRMVECKGNVSHSAKSLDIGIRTLQRKLHQYGVPLGSQEYRAKICLQLLGVKEVWMYTKENDTQSEIKIENV